MLVPEELKLNKFRAVNIPDKKSYFTRQGMVEFVEGKQYTEDDILMPDMNTTDQLAYTQEQIENGYFDEPSDTPNSED